MKLFRHTKHTLFSKRIEIIRYTKEEIGIGFDVSPGILMFWTPTFQINIYTKSFLNWVNDEEPTKAYADEETYGEPPIVSLARLEHQRNKAMQNFFKTIWEPRWRRK